MLERTDTITQYRDEEEIRYSNEYHIHYREETEIRYNTVFDEHVRIEHETRYRVEEETRYNTVYNLEYQTVISTETREVPVITYETAYRDEETVTYETVFETMTRQVPVERQEIGAHSNDSGDGVESEPEQVIFSDALSRYQTNDATINLKNQNNSSITSENPSTPFGRDMLRSYLDRYKWAQTNYWNKFATADSSDDYHVYTVIEFVDEEYEVSKKVPVVTIGSVPYQIAKTEYITEEIEVENLEPVEVATKVPYTI